MDWGKDGMGCALVWLSVGRSVEKRVCVAFSGAHVTFPSSGTTTVAGGESGDEIFPFYDSHKTTFKDFSKWVPERAKMAIKKFSSVR